MTFPEVNSPLRTNEAFNDMLYEDHHKNNIKSPLTQLSIGMVTDFVLDYMHLVCLGVMRKLLQFWVKGPLKTRLSTQQVMKISEHQKLLRSSIPNEFMRKPRSLTELDRWKATEFRLFLLYTGPLVLKYNLHPILFKHFLLFHVAISCLVSSKLCQNMCNFAQKLLTIFVQHSQKLYGPEFITYNVHCLVHLPDDVSRFGALDEISAFPFENYLQSVKKLIPKPSLPLEQVIKRVSEKMLISVSNKDTKNDYPMCKYEHNNGPICPELFNIIQYKSIKLQSYMFSLTKNKNCVFLNTSKVGILQNIIKKDLDVYIVVKLFCNTDSFYEYPLDSKLLNTFKVSQVEDKVSIYSINDVVSKCVCLPINESEHLIISFL
ncbi:uncharacterized protein LOC124813452 isoform X1 [Hydra vulgaris]|uniref:uncharacterized protein LOC124813452 isoform X1 n=1 Tax=Hydra vulgaris TaxID=6087 RepID=UPI0032E9E0C7